MLDDIPAPRVLHADRLKRADRDDMTVEDHRSQAILLEEALQESCDYAQQLWNDVAAMRQYLHDSLPTAGAQAGMASAAAPRGPDDEQGWARWQDAFAELTSVLCGPHGDGGFGRSSALLLARDRRSPGVAEAEKSQPELVGVEQQPDQDPQPEQRDEAASADDTATVTRLLAHPWAQQVLGGVVGAAVTAAVLVPARLRRNR